MRSAMSSGVTNRRFSQFVPSSAIRSPIVRPTPCDGTNTHLARRDVRAAQLRKLLNEWIHQRVSNLRRTMPGGSR